jgi:hypothetical protein
MFRAPKSMFRRVGRRCAIALLLVTGATSIPQSARVMASSRGTAAGAEKPAPQASLHPDALPANTSRMLIGRRLRSFSVGARYARTESYPAGVYGVVLSLD